MPRDPDPLPLALLSEVEQLRAENRELKRVLADLEPLARELAGILRMEVTSWPSAPYSQE